MLPFENYTWNFTQHAIGLNPRNLFSLLSAASLFEGSTGFGEKINAILISNNVLTSNIRNGKPDAWRDYQQILSETGLIYSTKIERHLRLTEAGRLLLQGEIGFAELMSIQALRYQYPNGLKSSFLNQHIESGVLVKPGTLILRILLELAKNNMEAFISVDQCQNFILPISRNENWPFAFEKISKGAETDTSLYRHARRNIQDWFKFLNTTELFNLVDYKGNSSITLTRKVLSDIGYFDTICSMGENASDFWIPASSDNSSLLTWFSHFGHLPTEYFGLLETNVRREYVTENYFELPDDDEFVTEKVQRKITLANVSESGVNVIDYAVNEGIPLQINSGYIKRREKTKLHNEMINELVKFYRERDCEVFEGRQSIDLLIKLPSNDISIFEVKTATPRNIFPRTRLAVGQIIEYGYRYELEYGQTPKTNIVLNVDMEFQPWLKDYLNKHLDIGLVSVLGNTLKGFPESVLMV